MKKAQKRFEIIGRVVNVLSNKGIANLKVEAWDKDLLFDDMVGSAVTDEHGTFSFLFSASYFSELFGDKYPDLYFKVYRGTRCLASTEKSVLWNIKTGVTPVLIPLEEKDDIPPGQEEPNTLFSISGEVVKPDGTPIAGVNVEAYDTGLGAEKLLGETKTDTGGKYVIHYTRSVLIDINKNHADLIVRAHKGTGKNKIELSSPLILNAFVHETINLVSGEKAYQGPPEYKQLDSILATHLQNATFDSITPKDIAILAAKTHLNEKHIAYYVKAHRHASQTAIPPQVFYGLYRKNMPTSLIPLLSQKRTTHQKAITDAIEGNIIDASIADEMDSLIEQLRDLNVIQVRNNNEPEKNPVSKLLHMARLTKNDQQKFLNAYSKQDKPMGEIWDKLQKPDALGVKKTARLQKSIQIAALTRNHLPLTEALLNNTDITDGKDLAKYTLHDWKNLLKNSEIGVPDDVEGETIAQRREKFARTLCHIVEDAFPTNVIGSRWQKRYAPQNNDISLFFQNNPDFDFRINRVRTYLNDNPDAMKGMKDPEKFQRDFIAFQRLNRLAPRYDKFDIIHTLFSDNVHSAHSIKRMGKKTFLKKYASEENYELYKMTYEKAEFTHGMALHVLFMFGKKYNKIQLKSIPALFSSIDESGIADIETLFGSEDFCACEHCRSVLSPSAYLVDQLIFLNNALAKDGNTALEKFFNRRPDIGNIDLTCKNSMTPMPYIDLVNETLENAIIPLTYTTQDYSGVQLPISDEVPQTTAQAEELKANPEHINIEAYAHLLKNPGNNETTVYPWNLPFDFWREEAAVYLNHLQTTRYELVKLFRNNDQVWTNEYFNLIPREIDLIATATTNATLLKKYWGIKTGNLAQLKSILPFMNHARISFDELKELLLTNFINPDGSIQIHFSSDDPCSLSDAVFSDMSSSDWRSFLDRTHRFCRLKTALQWSAINLDRALRALNTTALSLQTIQKLAVVKELEQRFRKTDLVVIYGWIGSHIDTAFYDSDASPYDRLFLNKSINNPLDDLEGIFGLNNDRNELAAVDKHLNDPQVAPLVRGVLRIDEDELDVLIAQELSGDTTLNLANLSYLYRISSFAQALKLSIADYLSLKNLSGRKPLTDTVSSTQPSKTLAFVKLHQTLRQEKISMEQLEYTLAHHTKPSWSFIPSDQKTGQFLSTLRTELFNLRNDLAVKEDTDKRTALEKKLSLVLIEDPDMGLEDKVQTALAIIDRTSTLLAADQQLFIENNFLVFISDIPTAVATLLAPLPADPIDRATELENRYTLVLDQLLDYLIPFLLHEKVIHSFATHLTSDPRIIGSMLAGYIEHPTDPSLTAIDLFLDSLFIDSIDPIVKGTLFDDRFYCTELLFKISLIVSDMKIRAQDIPFIVEEAFSLGWLDLTALPMTSIDYTTAADNFTAWLKLIYASRLQKMVVQEEHSVFEIIESANTASLSRAQILDLLAENTQWNREYIVQLCGPSFFNVTFISEGGTLQDEQWLIQLKDAMKCIKRVGTNPSRILEWTEPEVTYQQARAIKNAVKAKYEYNEWLKINASLRDELRERQRDALVAYVMHENDFEDVDAIYSYYFIDTQMSACALTSRIKQAISSVQLFVQRIMMNLEEDDIEFEAGEAKEWKWRKNYRVWEANRKVFLYPENWVEPELRDDKSPFFQDLENELMQGEVTDMLVEKAYINYLQKLDEVANLEIATVYLDEEKDRYHVFARTRNTPPIYFHRIFTEDKEWTSWEKLNLDIEGGQLVPFIFNRRLYLFWLKFIEAAEEQDDASLSTPTNPEKYFDVKISWSQYRYGQWSGSKTSEKSIRSRTYSPLKKECYYIYPIIDQISKDLFLYGIYEKDSTFTFFGHFEMKGSNDMLIAYPWTYTAGTSSYYRPFNTKMYNMKFRSDDTRPLQLKIAESSDFSNQKDVDILLKNIQFDVATPTKTIYDNRSNIPFFYEGARRLFFVTREDKYLTFPGMVATQNPYDVREIDPSIIDIIYAEYVPPVDPIDPIDPIPHENDPRVNYYRGVNEHIGVINRMVNNGPVIFGRPSTASVRNASAGSGAMRGSSMPVNTPTPRMATRRESSPNNPNPNSMMLYQTRDSGNTNNYSVGTSLLSEIGSILGEFGVSSWTSVKIWVGKKFTFHLAYHPYSTLFIKQLNQYGIEGLLQPDPEHGELAQKLIRQKIKSDPFFEADYIPTDVVSKSYPNEMIDFSSGGPYSQYNYELFFHMPLLIATRLMQNQRFEEAQKWFHYIFNPTEVEGLVPQRLWKCKPFHEYDKATSATQLFKLLNEGDKEVDKQVAIWEKYPFSPHRIARLRTVSYMRSVVMKYLDNLIAWADMLFRRDGIESINEATQLYVLAGEILGRKPEEVDGIQPPTQTFNSMYPDLDSFSNALITLESELPPGGSTAGTGESSMLDTIFYFCIPNNPRLLGYWDIVADRLYKIRHCLNIEGVKRQLALFEPPIDPGMLVKAMAKGGDFGSLFLLTAGPLPHYRFEFMIKKTLSLCSDVKSLGGQLLNAIKTRNAEELTLIRNQHQANITNKMLEIKELGVTQIQENILAIDKSIEAAECKRDRYQQLLDDGMNGMEIASITLKSVASGMEVAGGLCELISFVAHSIPDFTIGASGISSPVAVAKYGGSNVAWNAKAAKGFLQSGSQACKLAAMIIDAVNKFERLKDDWHHSADMAHIELERLSHQKTSAETALVMAEKNVEQTEMQIEQMQELQEFYENKFNNLELYDWMIGQISTLYFQAYQLAYDTALQTERCFRLELADFMASFIEPEYWDSLRQGLMSGENLHKDLRRMEMAYIEQNRREYELTKHVSLTRVNPLALLVLREHGSCEFTVPEVLFDLDFPGHYLRRIKSVSLTFNCEVDEITGVTAQLTLLNNRIRMSSSTSGDYAYEGVSDLRFMHNVIGIQSIATSQKAQDDGLFVLSFSDDRYLPFEYAGAISQWKLELPSQYHQFNYHSIQDVVLSINYTARNGGEIFRQYVENALEGSLNKMLDILSAADTGLLRYFSLRNEFGTEAADLISMGNTTITLETSYFPHIIVTRTMSLHESVELYLIPRDGESIDTSSLSMTLRGQPQTGSWSVEGNMKKALFGISGDPLGDWPIEITSGSIDSDLIEDIVILVRYTILDA